MTRPKQFVLLNLACTVGLIASLFLLPPQTPLWTWGAGSLLCFAVLNITLAVRGQQRKVEEAQSSTDTGTNWLRLAVLSITAVVVGLDFHYHKSKLDALSLVSALLAIVVLVWSILKKSKKQFPKS